MIEVAPKKYRMPAISIITPTYNRAAFLGRMIESVLAQSFKDWELIILDDGSSDNSHEVVKSFNDERIRYFYSEHEGAGAKRNEGIKKASSDFVTFLDSDDEAMPQWLEEVHKKIRKDYSLISCGYERGLGNRSKQIVYPQNIGKENFKVNFKSGTLSFNKEVLIGIDGFDPSLESGLNTDLILRTSKFVFDNKLSYTHIDKPLVRVYEHSENRIRNNTQAVLSGTLRLFNKHSGWFEENPHVYKDYLLVAAISMAKEGKYEESKKMLSKAWRIRPLDIKVLLRLIIIYIPIMRKLIWGKIRVK